MRASARFKAAGIVVVLAALRPSPAGLPAPASRVEVSVNVNGPVVVRTAAGEFLLGRGGCIEARFLAGARRLSLDAADESADCGSSVTIDGAEASGLALDFRRAWVTDVDAVDGGPGRRIEIPGRLASGDVSSVGVTFTLEALDSSPNAVSTMLAYRNNGEDAVTIDSVSLPERRLSASHVDPASAPHALWSFHGSSEHVGRDEVVPLAPGFARTNALGTPDTAEWGEEFPSWRSGRPRSGLSLGHLEPGGSGGIASGRGVRGRPRPRDGPSRSPCSSGPGRRFRDAAPLSRGLCRGLLRSAPYLWASPRGEGPADTRPLPRLLRGELVQLGVRRGRDRGPAPGRSAQAPRPRDPLGELSTTAGLTPLAIGGPGPTAFLATRSGARSRPTMPAA